MGGIGCDCSSCFHDKKNKPCGKDYWCYYGSHWESKDPKERKKERQLKKEKEKYMSFNSVIGDCGDGLDTLVKLAQTYFEKLSKSCKNHDGFGGCKINTSDGCSIMGCPLGKNKTKSNSEWKLPMLQDISPVRHKPKIITGTTTICRMCRSWTKNKNHKHYICYTNDCPAYKRDKNKEKNSLKFF